MAARRRVGVRSTVLAGSLAASCLLASCSTSGGKEETKTVSPKSETTTTTEQPTTTTEATTSTSEATTTTSEPAETGIAGAWEGTYTCAQGLTHLDLTVDDDLSATFEFSPVPSNPDVETGSYSMTGTLDGDTLRLEPDAWIDQSPTYVMVGLEGDVPTSDAPDEFSGTVIGSGCTTFDLTRA